jgi:class 3 adenylate cyclase
MTARILFVDDEPDLEDLVLQRFRKQIADNVVAFQFARDGLDALEALAQNPAIDLVVSDINMPRMDGLTLLQKLQEADDKLATIIVSAYGDMSNIRTAMNRGAFDFLMKPIDFHDLQTTIFKTIAHVEMLRDTKRKQLDAEKAQAALSRYFSPRVAARLAMAGDASIADIQRRNVAAIFTDIAGFTSLVETTDTEILSALLNDYMGGMTDLVFQQNGTVAKLVGDAIHILFNAPEDQLDYAARAIACAVAMDAWAQAFRVRWKSRGCEVGVTRIGVHAGPVLVGNFGSSQYFDYTAYGDTINTAARLEAANKYFGSRICISEAAVKLAGSFSGRPIGDLVLRGRTEAIRAYEPCASGTRDESASLAAYAAAFAKLEAGEAGALPAFANYVGSHSDDPIAEFHLKRLLNGARGVRVQLD